MKPRVRFAPSPTGQVHIGNIRTAIFNWLYARHEGGDFLLRIEDTDRQRSTDEAITQLFEVLEWLGLDVDGEPFYQSTQQELHLQAAAKLLDQGNAYKDFKGGDQEAVIFQIPTDLDDVSFVREAGEQDVTVHPDEPLTVSEKGVSFALVSKKGKPVPHAACLAGYKNLKVYDADGQVILNLEGQAPVKGGETLTAENPVRITYTRRNAFYTDTIKGELAKPLDSMKDFVIVRSDGSPVFHLANVYDDVTQGITHILRGDDHVENTYRHLFLFHALGAVPPAYGHFPMIVNQQGKPYSKRDGDAYVGDFRDKGYLPDALFNYLTLLGWAPGDDREKMTRQEIVDAFTLDRVGSAAAQMDIRELDNLNGQYMAEMDFDAFVAQAKAEVAAEPWLAGVSQEAFEAVATLMQSRAKSFKDIASWAFFFSDELEYDEKGVRKNLKKDGVQAAITVARAKLADVESFTAEAIEAAIHATTEEVEMKQGKLNQPLRVATTGTTIGAGIYETFEILGRDTVLRRLDYALANLWD